MQEVTTLNSGAGTTFDQLRSSALVDNSSRSRAFSDFLGLMSQTGSATATQGLATQINSAQPLANAVDSSQTEATAAANSVAASTQADTGAATAAVAAQTHAAAADAVSNTAKNAPVSREAFEEAKPLLAKAGFSDAEMAELSARVQAGTLTWGQLVQNLGGHMTGAKKAMKLSASETAEMQTLFQKLGFAANVAAQMVQSVAQGENAKVLAAVQTKLTSLPDDTSLGLDKGELATFFKAMRVPGATANKLTQLLGAESTVADMKAALAEMGQALQDQRAKTSASDSDLAKGLGKIMQKDVAKSSRDATQAVTDGTGAQVSYELKTKDKNDTAWFSQHEKNQQKSSDDVWRSFLSRAKADDSVTQASLAAGSLSGQGAQTAAQAAGKDALDLVAARSGQGVAAQAAKADASQSAKSYEKVNAPKILDQVSEAMLKDLGQGRKQLTMQLDPENLGKVQVMLQVKGKEVTAVIRAEDADAAAMLSSNMESLKKSLEDQGLTVQSMDVQTGLSSQQEHQAAFSADQHNQAQERQEMTRIFSQLRMLRTDAADVAPEMHNMDVQAILADRGLHIIA